METDQDNIKPNNRRSASYAGLTYLFLLLLSVFWSADSSFIYIFLGGAIFFLFLTFKTISFKTISKQHDDPHFEELKNEASTETNDVLHDLKSTLKDKGISFEQAQHTVSSNQSNQRIVLLVVGGIMLFFFSLIFIGIFSSINDEDDQFYFQQAEMFYDETQYDSAYRYFKKTLSINEESVEAMTGLGNVFMMKEQNDSSLIMYNKALALDPENEKTLYQKALLLFYQKQYNESVYEAKNLLELNPQYVEALQLIGDNYYTQEKYNEAEPWYDSAYVKGLRNRYLCHLMGYINQSNGKTQKAISLYKEALKYDSSVVDIYERLADIVPENEKNWYRQKIIQLQSQQ